MTTVTRAFFALWPAAPPLRSITCLLPHGPLALLSPTIGFSRCFRHPRYSEQRNVVIYKYVRKQTSAEQNKKFQFPTRTFLAKIHGVGSKPIGGRRGPSTSCSRCGHILLVCVCVVVVKRWSWSWLSSPRRMAAPPSTSLPRPSATAGACIPKPQNCLASARYTFRLAAPDMCRTPVRNGA